MQYKGKQRKGEVQVEESAHNYRGAIWPQVKFITCLGILGRKWTILILRDIGFLRIDRLNRILESIQGLTPRILSIRLKQLENEGFIERIEEKKSSVIAR